MKIITERTHLRPFEKEDAYDVYEYCKVPEVGTDAGWKPHESVEETKEILDTVFIGKEHIFAIEMGGKVVGSVGFMPDPKRQNDNALMLGYALSKEYWGRGIMTECAKAIVEYAFNLQGIDLLTATCYSYNKKSRRVIEKCGFTHEGVLHGADKRFDGVLCDLESFYLTKEGYERLKV